MSILEKMQHSRNIIKHDANFLMFNAASKVVCDSSVDFSNKEGKLKKKLTMSTCIKLQYQASCLHVDNSCLTKIWSKQACALSSHVVKTTILKECLSFCSLCEIKLIL